MILIIGYDRKEKRFLQYKLFTALLVSDVWLLFLETVGWALDGVPGQTNHVINTIVNVVALVSDSIPQILWFFYVDYQIYRNRDHIIKRFRLYVSPALISTALVITSPFTGMVFYLDSNNVYHRGPLFIILLLMAYSYFVLSFLFVMINRKKVDKNNFVPLLLFPVPPIIGGVLQGLFYGVSLVWSGMALSLLIIYITIQNRILNTDYLTGLFNRRQLDDYLKRKLNDRQGTSKFSIMMIDIDEFKKINDTYGHNAGDKAIIAASNILRSSLREDDFIGRYAGDEFVVIQNIYDKANLESAVDRIRDKVNQYNQSNCSPYRINFSIGYDIFSSSDGLTLEQCIKNVDMLMYREKRRKRLYGM
jgi:diguanylate cyclase (GGDEF)-like protein